MGNNKPAEPKRKKKGRPSLLDLQKRSLRLQKQQQSRVNPNPNPNPNHSLRSPVAAKSLRRSTRRNPNPNSDDDDGDSSNDTRREKKIKLVHRIQDDADQEKGEGNNPSKGTDDNALRGEIPSDLGPTTPLPDKKLLEFILDRLQKKDTYGVFSEPVDPEELPDYHEIIEHPIDFATIKKKLSSGAYSNLEQFEEDVFLISSNAMQYNAADTIYYRQARAIQELAKKNFENLRQESDDDQPEPKIVARRGRPPTKNINRAVGRPEQVSDFSSNETFASVGDGPHLSNLANNLSRKGSAPERPGLSSVSARSPYNLRQTEPFRWAGLRKSESNEEYSGYGPKGSSTKYGKMSVVDENRRNTYNQPHPSAFEEPSILTAFDGERKQLKPNGLHIQHSYARSLAHFAANLGPIGWAIAAKKIERVLPPGTKFGPGWIEESEAPKSQQPQPTLMPASPPFASSSSPNVSTCPLLSRSNEVVQEVRLPSNDLATEVNHLRRTQPLASTSMASNRSETVVVDFKAPESSNHEGDNNNTASKNPFPLNQNLRMQSNFNGCNIFGFNVPSKVGSMVIPTRPSTLFSSDAQTTRSRALDMVSRNNTVSNNSFQHQPHMRSLDAERAKLVGSSGHNQMEQDFVPPDLNVMVDTQQPDLALPRWMKNIVAKGT
ncbi:uncharacterized protein A4U43_C04F13850 [Asparagus officinalis]|uniref:Bromo domain-containing protein n=1 Tax=Asparagus officinalis TaxID=4686 RepID=A0A5P1F0P1_ASPOF|nr:peregrin-like isoform X2 [Asparagus officinalis]ONK71928.1 uncharacterized protein A4U43_C04F13850 [Asparagus officinalis]